MTRRHRKSKTDDTRLEIYGRGEVLNEHDVEPMPERELLSAVFMQAVINVSCKVNDWESDLRFLKGAGNFPLFCVWMDYDKDRMSRATVRAATSQNFRFAKWR